MISEEKTTIWLKKSTKDRLKKHGNLNTTFDDVLNQLLDKVEGKENE